MSWKHGWEKVITIFLIIFLIIYSPAMYAAAPTPMMSLHKVRDTFRLRIPEPRPS